MTADSIERGLAACQAWLSSRDEPESAIVAQEAGVAASDEDARRWIQRLLHVQDETGHWEGSLLSTATSLLTIHELREAAGVREQDPGIGRGFDWLVARRGAPGSWAGGCSPDRHREGLCHHFLGGFFSPGPPEVPCEPVRMPSGAPVEADPEIRLVSSIVALRALMRWGLAGRDAALHLEGLRSIVTRWEERRPAGLTTTSLLAAVHALILSPDDDDRAAAEHGLRLMAGRQRGDGSWVDTDAFQAMEVLGAAVDAGIDLERTRRSLWHGARLLVSTQHADGSWGALWGARRALIAWRTFRRVDPVGR